MCANVHALSNNKHDKLMIENKGIHMQNLQMVNQYFEHFNNHDWEEMANMYLPVAEFKDPTLGPGIIKQSRKQIVDKYSQLSEIFPDVKDNIVEIYHAGKNKVIVEFLATGTAPDGERFELAICTIFTIENGLISKDFSYFDNAQE